MTIATKLLILLIWTGVAVLLYLLNRIGRFFQITTGVRSFYQMFLVPLVLFLLGMARYLVIEAGFAGDVLGDLLFFAGGVCLSLVGYFLFRLMMGGR